MQRSGKIRLRFANKFDFVGYRRECPQLSLLPWCLSVLKSLKTGPSPAKSDVERLQMTPIPAKVFAVDKQGDQYNLIVRIGLAKYRGSFNTLAFGENKPFTDLCHNAQLDLFTTDIPALKQGSRSRCGRFCDSSHAAGDPWKVALLPFLRKLPNHEHLRRRA